MSKIVILVNRLAGEMSSEAFVLNLLDEIGKELGEERKEAAEVIDIGIVLPNETPADVLKELAENGELDGKAVLTYVQPGVFEDFIAKFSLGRFVPRWDSFISFWPQIALARYLNEEGAEAKRKADAACAEKEEKVLSELVATASAGECKENIVMIRGRPVKKKTMAGDEKESLAAQDEKETETEKKSASNPKSDYTSGYIVCAAISAAVGAMALMNVASGLASSMVTVVDKLVVQAICFSSAAAEDVLTYCSWVEVKVVDKVPGSPKPVQMGNVRNAFKKCVEDSKTKGVVAVLRMDEKELEMIIDVIGEQMSNSKGLTIVFTQYLPDHLVQKIRKDGLFKIKCIDAGDITGENEIEKGAETMAKIEGAIERGVEQAKKRQNATWRSLSKMITIPLERTYTSDGDVEQDTEPLPFVSSLGRVGFGGIEISRKFTGDRKHGKVILRELQYGAMEAVECLSIGPGGAMVNRAKEISAKKTEDLESEVDKAIGRITLAEEKLRAGEATLAEMQKLQEQNKKLAKQAEKIGEKLEKAEKKLKALKALQKKVDN